MWWQKLLVIINNKASFNKISLSNKYQELRRPSCACFNWLMLTAPGYHLLFPGSPTALRSCLIHTRDQEVLQASCYLHLWGPCALQAGRTQKATALNSACWPWRRTQMSSSKGSGAPRTGVPPSGAAPAKCSASLTHTKSRGCGKKAKWNWWKHFQ